MDPHFVEDLIALARTAGVTDFEYETGGERVRFSLPARQRVASIRVEGRAPGPAASGSPEVSDHVQRSFMDGIFYRAASRDDPPFVSAGDAVNEGQTIGLLEVMKMLSPVEAAHSGTIGEFHVEDGQRLGPGDAIVSIRRR